MTYRFKYHLNKKGFLPESTALAQKIRFSDLNMASFHVFNSPKRAQKAQNQDTKMDIPGWQHWLYFTLVCFESYAVTKITNRYFKLILVYLQIFQVPRGPTVALSSGMCPNIVLSSPPKLQKILEWLQMVQLSQNWTKAHYVPHCKLYKICKNEC